MNDIQIVWDDEDDPDGNTRHILDGHDVTLEEVEEVLYDRIALSEKSRTSGLPIVIGKTSQGRKIAVVWSELCDNPWIVYPITAYPVD
ncbi:MAG TPA: hypothetical protein VKX17_18300 [Planctomycetota bacterium]|nr:hypothetical protein [Planctomycetota bacterium]